jgi:hypothetical protein
MSQMLSRGVRHFQKVKAEGQNQAIRLMKIEEFRRRVLAKMEELKAQGGQGPYLENIARSLIIKERIEARRVARS